MDTPDRPRGAGRASYDVVRPGTGPDPGPPPPSRRAGGAQRLDAGRLWAGGVLTAGVAGLTAAVAVLLVRGVLGMSVSAPSRGEVLGEASPGVPAAAAASAALAATGLLHLLVLVAPRPGRFFSWITGLTTAGLVLLPFGTAASTADKVGTATVHLAVGVTIGSLLSAVGRGALRRGR